MVKRVTKNRGYEETKVTGGSWDGNSDAECTFTSGRQRWAAPPEKAAGAWHLPEVYFRLMYQLWYS